MPGNSSSNNFRTGCHAPMHAEDQINTQGSMQAEDQTDEHYQNNNKNINSRAIHAEKIIKIK